MFINRNKKVNRKFKVFEHRIDDIKSIFKAMGVGYEYAMLPYDGSSIYCNYLISAEMTNDDYGFFMENVVNKLPNEINAMV